MMMGPLQGIKIVELAGLGPCPMTGMMLADMGAEVIRIERGLSVPLEQERDPSFRGKRSMALDLKCPEGVACLLELIETADALIEGYRPGVMERLGLGPDICLERNPRLVYGRITGWGREGPLAETAGHDLNYIALSGVLHAVGRCGERPVPPLNLVGDMGGGMLAAFGVVCALLEARHSRIGQVVDTAMIDCAAQMMWMQHAFHAAGQWDADERGVNILDGGRPYYDTYETADGRYLAVAAIEPQFYAALIKGLGEQGEGLAELRAAERWSELRSRFAAIFSSRTRDAWAQIFEHSDACVSPVLSFTEAPDHPHNQARDAYIKLNGDIQAAPAPRFSRTGSSTAKHIPRPGTDGASVLLDIGWSAGRIEALRKQGILKMESI